MSKRLVESDGEPLIDSIRPAIAELERLVEWAYARYGGERPDGCSPVVVLVQTRGAKKKACGWFWAERWSTREGALRHELTLTAEQLSRPVPEILATTIHEVVHFFARDNGIQDVSQGGRHNGEFREVAQDFGLIVATKGSAGCAATTLSPALAHTLKASNSIDNQAMIFLNFATIYWQILYFGNFYLVNFRNNAMIYFRGFYFLRVDAKG